MKTVSRGPRRVQRAWIVIPRGRSVTEARGHWFRRYGPSGRVRRGWLRRGHQPMCDCSRVPSRLLQARRVLTGELARGEQWNEIHR